MRLRVSVWLLSLLASVFLIVSLGGSIDAEAALSGGRYMTVQECLDTFGTSFDVKYFNGSEFVTVTASYSTTNYTGSIPSVAVTDFIQTGRTLIDYTFSASGGAISSNPEQIQIDISPQYSLFDIDQLHTFIAINAGATYTTVYQSPQWIWMFGGSRFVFEGISSDNQLYRIPCGSYGSGNQNLALYAPVDWDSQSLTSGYSLRATFCSGSFTSFSGVYHVYIAVPYITDNFSGSNGTFSSSTSGTSSSSSGDINVSVDVDMEETNGLLRGIPAAIAGIFIPSDDDLQSWLDDMEGVFHDTFGQYTEVDSVLDDMEDLLYDTSPSAVVELPAVSIPNTSITLESRRVDLVRPEFSGILDIIKWAFDIAATCLFVNTMKRKLDEIILGKVIVESEDGD